MIGRWALLSLCLASLSCSQDVSRTEPLKADLALHLEDHLQAAHIVGSEVPAGRLQPVEWRFDEPRPEWKAYDLKRSRPLEVEQVSDALRVRLTERNRDARFISGALYVGLPDWDVRDWDHLLIRARTRDRFRWARVAFNLGEGRVPSTGEKVPFQNAGNFTQVIPDGNVQTYRIPLRPRWPEWKGPWRQLIILLRTLDPAAIDIISITAVPTAAVYGDLPTGVRSVEKGESIHWTLFQHAPGRIEFLVRVPPGGRLDAGLGVIRTEKPVTFSVSVRRDEATETLLEEEISDPTTWSEVSVDLSTYAGEKVTLSLAAEAEGQGEVALWGAPTLSGSSQTTRPNVLLYVIDSAGADWMSVYGYNRHTTPYLEQLAAEGAVFERAYSNATWTKLSNPSFLTSMYPTVLGWYRGLSDRIPEGVTTMAEHFDRAGYQTAFFTSNVVGSTLSGLERGVDTLWVGSPPINSTSSDLLHRKFWDWREAYPASPYFVHFQTTDVHEPFDSQPPFAGLFLSPDEREEYFRWDEALDEAGGFLDLEAYGKVGITKQQFARAQQALYDECMAHQDSQLRRLVGRLKATGDWANTILIITSDHGYPAGSHRLMEPMELRAPYFHPFATRIPLIVVWPGHIAPGGRFVEPVSLIDLLPTLLELAGLPAPKLAQGRSLARAFLDGNEPEPRPVIIERPSTDFQTGELIGTIEVVDGHWGASLVVSAGEPGEIPELRAHHGDGMKSHYGRPQQLVLYDLLQDPFCTRHANEERPDLVEKYRDFLNAKWAENVDLRKQIGAAGEVQLTPEQLDRLRSLGYIQ